MWVTNRGGQRSLSGESEAIIGRKSIPLDFSIKLDRFKMDEIEGTGKPASYESFVKVKNSTGIETSEHVYMNNPYKAAGYTFYQSSYFQDERGQYSSVFSVNRDPGRAIKYLGSLLLVFGLIMHFLVIHGYVFKQVSTKKASVDA
jgi:cytochrome c biogenesis protein ResB